MHIAAHIMVLGFAAACATNIVAAHAYDRLDDPDNLALMATPSPYAKDLGNLVYHAAVVGGLSVGYSMAAKKFLKMKPADLGRLDIEDSTKVVGTIALALWTQDMLVKNGIIPTNIIKST
jgi:hypothetical protein